MNNAVIYNCNHSRFTREMMSKIERMNYRWLILVIYLILVITFCTLWGLHLYSKDSYLIYSGKETFQTEQEYSKFKQAVSKPQVIIRDIVVLSSSPIVVGYIVRTPRDFTFPYGEKELKIKWPLAIAAAIGSTLPGLILYGVLFRKDKRVNIGGDTRGAEE